jgi:hypothetical protein
LRTQRVITLDFVEDVAIDELDAKPPMPKPFLQRRVDAPNRRNRRRSGKP